MSSKSRLDSLEAAVFELTLNELARRHGLTPDAIMEEVRALEAMTLAQQLASVDEHAAALTADGYDVGRLKAELCRAAGFTPRPPSPAKRRHVSRPSMPRSS